MPYTQELPSKPRLSIKALESIRLEKENNKKIANLILGGLQLSIKAVKSEKQFNFDEGLYKNYLVAELSFPQLSSNPLEVGRKQIKLKQWTRILVTIQKTVSINSKTNWKLVDCVPVLELGCEQGNKSLECKLKQIIFSPAKNSNPQPDIEKQCKQKQRELHDGPLDTLPTTQIPSIQQLKQYKSPVSKNGRLFLCHDMEDGYKQDVNKHSPFPKQNNKYKKSLQYSHTYRNLHLMQAEIFNYFSHKLITIPPKHWRRLCKITNTKCLGTYIVQRNYPTEDQYLSDYTIKLLVYFCRKYRYDGYLINFQYEIKNVGLLLPWLTKLTCEMHKAVPGSQIIWYDSVITNGKVSYQNQLNANNETYYRACDGIFLNYWWSEDKLANSMSRVFQNKVIYVGSDCFGRGSFAGGRYNTHKAINAIRKADNGNNILAPALFAMGFTYQLQKQNIEAWKINEKCMYRGMSYMKLEVPHNQWEYANMSSNGYTWKIDNEWAITSFQVCKRMFKKRLSNIFGKQTENGSLVINFFTTVAGTGPKFQDPYRITLRVSLQGVVVNEATTEMREASQVQQIINLKINVDQDLLTEQTVLTVIEEGHDCEKWGGHYGSRFKNDHLYITKYCKQNDWMPRIKTNFAQGVSLPYISYYNMGHGHHFYVQGQKVKKSYDYLCDFDANFAYIMNPPLYTNIYYHDAFMGGTCLQVEQTKKLKLIEFNLSKDLQQNLTRVRQICCRLAIKNMQGKPTFKLIVKFATQTKNIDKNEQQLVKNDWKYFTFKFDVAAEHQKSKIMLYLQSSLESGSYLLGQTAIFQQKKNSEQQHKIIIKSLEVAVSQNNPPVAPLFFDLMTVMSKPCKILFKFGQQFACFGWADELNSNKIIIKNVHNSQQSKNSKASIYLLNGSLIYTEYCTTKVDTQKLGIAESIKLI